MIYFSEFRGRKVWTEAGKYLGRLDDLSFSASDLPRITSILIKRQIKNKADLIPIHYLKKINRVLVVDKHFQTAPLGTNELFILKNLIDKQIIDLSGRRVVKVNDCALQMNKEFCLLLGVDIGLSGILRWLKLENFADSVLSIFGRKLSFHFLSWKDIQPLELTRGHVQLKIKKSKLHNLPPEDLADYLETTSVTNIETVLKTVKPSFAASVIANLNLNYQVDIFSKLKCQKAAQILGMIDQDEVIDILLAVSRHKREAILGCLEPILQKQISHLLGLSKTPLGRLMTTQYLTIHPTATAKEVLEKIYRETEDFTMFYYAYVINKEKKLVGVFNLHELLMQNQATPVYKFMVQNVVVIHLTTPEEIALKKMVKYKILSLPVTDKHKQVLGIVTYDNLAQAILKI